MKYRKNLIIFALFLIVSFFSCYDDKGNYSYEDGNIIIFNSEKGTFRDTVVKTGSHLKLVPELQVVVQQGIDQYDLKPFDPEKYDYAWVIHRSRYSQGKDTLAKTYILDTIVNVGSSPAPYQCEYAVIEKKTGVKWQFFFNLLVGEQFEHAFIFMSEDSEGNAELALYGRENQTDLIVLDQNILDRVHYPYRGGGANYVYANPMMQSPYIFISTGEGTGWITWPKLQSDSLRRLNTLTLEMRPDNYNSKKIAMAAYPPNPSSSLILFDEYGDAYATPTGNQRLYFQATFNYEYRSNEYYKAELAPYIGGGPNVQLFFDTKEKRMYRFVSSSAIVPAGLSYMGDDQSLLGHDLKYMQRAKNNNTYVITHKDGNYYKYLYNYGVGADYRPYVELSGQPQVITNGSLIEQAEHQVINIEYGFYYMSIGNKIYAYNPEGERVLEEVQFVDESVTLDPITCLHAEIMEETAFTMILVATYSEENGGRIYFMTPDQFDPRQITVNNEVWPTVSGLGRIVSISRF